MPERFAAACRWSGQIWRWGSEARSPERDREAAVKTTKVPSLLSAIEFAGLAVTPREVRALASVSGILSTVALLVAVGGARQLGIAAPWTAVPIVLSMPLLAYALVMGYPESRAKRMRLASLGETPEVVSYLAMSLAVRPSLERAVAFAAEHATGPVGARMRRILWDVHVRAKTRVEDAFLAFADDWGTWSEEAKQSLYIIAHAVREGSRDGLARALDRARAIAFEGARRRLREYAARLQGPASALFALGVMLPLVIGSMLPLISLGGVSAASVAVTRPPGDPVPWILLLDVAFPAVTFLFAHRVSSGRPAAAPRARIALRPFVALAGVPILLAAGVLVPSDFAALLALGGIAAILSIVLRMATGSAMRELAREAVLEREFPDALFQLGIRLSEGRGLESAIREVADGLPGTAAGNLFRRIAQSLRIGGGTVEEAVFGPHGALLDVRSSIVRASLRTVVELAAKDPAVAGRTALETSGHMRDLQAVGEDMRAALRPTVDAMRATAILFAPVVLGVTGALFALLADAFGGVAALPMAPATFQVALGIYLMATTAGIVHFATRVEAGPDVVRFASTLGIALPAGFSVFLATLALAGLVL